MKGDTPYQFRTTILPKLHSIEDILRLAEQLRGAMGYKLQNFNPGNTLDPAFENEPPYDHTTFCELQRRSQNIVSLSGLPLALAGRGLEARLQV
jgi:pyruvate formate lyase activating enzyme